ncbi:PilN domain-containing protein [Pseudomonas putida]|uniref:Uncharacterized protein n=1 Tax=Pseudomonas putida TaxID=303 RepID=A0A1Q9R9P2_PSEPU|nr:PilN domain-containing protein [Pseudomonas putida]OLS64041.1 hypothetical protein PSEMO_11090 [Pseudomonas putida]
MAGINLLPWREWRRQRAIRRWQGLLLASLLAGTLLSLLGVALVSQRLERQLEANARLSERIAGLSEGLAQVALLRERGEVLQAQWTELQGMVRQQGVGGDLLFRLMDIVPPGARLSELQLSEGELRLSGLARSGSDVAQLLRNLGQSPGLGAADLQELVSSPTGERFRLLVSLESS